MNKTARDYQAEIYKWAVENFSYQDRIGYGQGEEAGEYCHANLKYLQMIRGSSEKEGRKERYIEAIKDALGDMLIFHLHWAEESGIFLSFGEAEEYTQQTREVSRVEILSMIFQGIGRIMYLSEHISCVPDTHRVPGQRLLNNIAALCNKHHGWHFVIDVLEPIWNEVKKRNFVKFPKNGLTE